MDIQIFGSTYDFPTIKDERFDNLQEDIASTRKYIEEGSQEKTTIFGLRKSTPSLSLERRLELMERLVGRYDELLAYLKSRIGDCRIAFEEIGKGVRLSFESKVRELEILEVRRADLVNDLKAKGKGDQATMLDAERERIRALARNLAEASLLIIRKLRHALEALEVLAADGTSQVQVLNMLRGDVGMYRKVWEFNRDLDRLQDDITELTQTALEFDSLLRDKLGPLGILVDEIAKVDRRVAESLAEIQALSMRLEKNQSAGTDSISLGGNILDVLVGVKVKTDLVASILERLSTDADSPFEGFDLELVSREDLNFHALTSNMSALVDQGFQRLSSPLIESVASATITEPVKVDIISDNSENEDPKNADQEDSTPQATKGEEPDSVPTDTKAGENEVAPDDMPGSVPGWVTNAELVGRGGASTAASTQKKPDRVQYKAAISRMDPTLILFLLDRSGSMDSSYSSGQSKAAYLAATVDRTLYELAVSCTRQEGVRDYFHIACLGYGDGEVECALPPAFSGEDWVPISRIARSPSHLVDVPGGGKEPRWIDPVSNGDTPMCAAFDRACRLAAKWCDAHPRSYPPTVINISDGEPTDGDPRNAASILGNIHTDDGEVLVFNLHVSSSRGGEVTFPSDPSCLDEYGRRLFEMSSRFPPHLLARAKESGFKVGPDSRFFAYGAGAELATRFLELGTRPSGLR